MLCPPGTIPNLASLCHGRQSAAAQLRLARTLRTSAGVGRNVRRSSPVRRHHVSCRQLDLRRSHARLRAQQRSLHRAPRVPQGDVPLPPCDRTPAHGCGAPQPCPSWEPQHPRVAPADVPLPSLLQEFERIPDHRRDQGRKFRLAVLLAIWQLARLSGYHGVDATWRYACHLTQDELRTLDAWRNQRTGHYHPPSRATLHRAMTDTRSRCSAGGPGPLARCACSRDHSTGRRWQSANAAPTARARPSTRPCPWSATTTNSRSPTASSPRRAVRSLPSSRSWRRSTSLVR